MTLKNLQEYSSFTKLRVSNKRKLIFQQFCALLIKRFHRVKRNLKGFIAEIVVPVIYVFLALTVATFIPTNDLRPELELHPWYYLTPNKIFLSKGFEFQLDEKISNTSQLNFELKLGSLSKYEQIKQVMDTFFQAPGPGNRCMNGHRILVKKKFNEQNELKCENADSKSFSYETMKITKKLDKFSKNVSECSCSSGFLECSNYYFDNIKYKNTSVLKTFDHIIDITAEKDISDWLVRTEFTNTFFKKRFGGFEFKKTKTYSNSNIKYLFSNFTQFAKTLINLLNTATLQNQTFSPVEYLRYLEFVGSNSLYSQDIVKIWYNPKGYDSSVSYLNVLNNAFLRSKTNFLRKDPSNIGNFLNIL